MKKVVLITGASGGMGAAAAKLFAKKGWQVVAGARTVEKIPKDNHILAVRLDVTDSASNQEFAARALERFGRIDVLINNAGYGEYGPTEEISMSDARYQLGLRSVIVQPGGTRTGWQKIAFDRTDKNTSVESPYQQLVDAVASVMKKVNISASAEDLAKVFYKAATDKKPKRRYYNSFGNHLYSWAARVFPGVMGTATLTLINQKMKSHIR